MTLGVGLSLRGNAHSSPLRERLGEGETSLTGLQFSGRRRNQPERDPPPTPPYKGGEFSIRRLLGSQETSGTTAGGDRPGLRRVADRDVPVADQESGGVSGYGLWRRRARRSGRLATIGTRR